MISTETLVATFGDLDRVELTNWVERGWIAPAGDGDASDWTFAEIDVARIRLVYDLRRSLDVAEQDVPLVLSLLDQVYALRATLRAVKDAVERQPQDLRTAVLDALRLARGGA